jgi:hypothetical protein
MDFTHYHGKHKRKKDAVAQISVAQKKYPVIRSRVSPALNQKIVSISKEKNLSISEMTRLLWIDYINKKETIDQREDIKHFLENT